MDQVQSGRVSRVFWSIFAGIFVEIFNKISPLIMLALAQRRLGVVSFGQAQFGISLIEMVLPWIVFGYTYQGAIEFSQRKHDALASSRLVANILTLRLIHALLAAFVLLILVFFRSSWEEQRLIILTLIPIVLVSALEMTYINFGSQKMVRLSVWVGTFKALTVIGVYFLVHEPSDAPIYALLTLIGGSLVSVASFIWVKKTIGIGSPDFKSMTKLFRKALVYAGVVLLFPLFERLDILLVESLAEPQELGIYAGPWRLALSLIPFFVVISNTFISEALAIKNIDDFRKNTFFAFFLCFASGLPIAFAVPFVGPDILELIFDSQFREYNLLFTIFCFSVVLEIFALIFGLQVLMLRGRSRQLAISLAFAICMGVIAGYLGMQIAGIYGLALGILLSRLIFTIWLIRITVVNLNSFPVRDTVTVMLSCIPMLACLFHFKDQPLWFLIALGGLVYVISLLILNWNKLLLLKNLSKGRLL